MNADHFIAVQAGLFEHFENGEMTPTMFACYSVVLYQADYETGFWRGSAPKIEAAWGGQIGERSIQDALKKLCEKGYLKSFHKKGRRGNYIVAINKYLIRFGKNKGLRLNADQTLDLEHPVYESPPESPSNHQGTDTDSQNLDLAGTSICPENGQASVHPDRSIGAASVPPTAVRTLDSPRDHRRITEGSPHLTAGIPDSSRLSQTVPNEEKPSRPSNQPDSTSAKGRKQRWLVGRVSTLVSHEKSIIICATEKERRALYELEHQYGTLLLLLAFYHFLERERGFDDLKFPIAMFVGEVTHWTARALEFVAAVESFSERNPDVLIPIKDLAELHSYPSGRQSLVLLLFLSIIEARKHDYSEGRFHLTAVEDFLKSDDPIVLQVAWEECVAEAQISALTIAESNA
jgi:hypothetical protein